MKKIVLAIVAIVSINSAAQAETLITGAGAQKIATSLEDAGAFADCGMGRCGTVAENIKCVEKGNATGQRRYSCSLSVQSETGDMKSVSIDGEKAKALLDAIEAAGIEGDCGMGTCGVEAKSIQVSFKNSKTPATSSYEATIEN